ALLFRIVVSILSSARSYARDDLQPVEKEQGDRCGSDGRDDTCRTIENPRGHDVDVDAEHQTEGPQTGADYQSRKSVELGFYLIAQGDGVIWHRRDYHHEGQ